MVSHLNNRASDHSDTAIECAIQGAAGNLSVLVFSNEYHDSYLKANPQKVFDNAKEYTESARPNRPARRMGFLPMWSESLLQLRTVQAWVTKNKDC